MWTEEEEETLRDMYASHTNKQISEVIDRSVDAIRKKGPRLGLYTKKDEMDHRKIQELEVPDTSSKYAGFVAGIIAGEAHFAHSETDYTDKFSMELKMAEQDKELVRDIADFFGVGSVYVYPARNKDWQDEVTYSVGAQADVQGVIIPFFDEVGFYSAYKQDQYIEWRSKFMEEAGIDMSKFD